MLASRHKRLFELGRGGMGTVFLAVSQGPAGFRKLKVVKVLNPQLADDPAHLSMFLHEARLSARLNHPNIVQTFEVGEEDADYFIEMEYLEGQSYSALSAPVGRGGRPLPLEVHLWILAQVLAGLHYAHELEDIDGGPLHIVHRDVSPHNVFVTYDGAVKVLDFGIAKASDTQGDTRTGVVKGKAAYMAPEQAARRPLDRRADVFAVGVMLWQAIAGKRMWEGLEEVDIFLQLRSGAIPSLRDAVADAPPELEALCARALAVDPEGRFRSAEEMQEGLEVYLENLPKVGGKRVGRLVSELFEHRRAAARREVERLLQGHAPRHGRIVVAGEPTPATPAVGLSPPIPIRPFDSLDRPDVAAETPEDRSVTAPSVTDDKRAAPGTSRRRLLFGMAGVALVAIGLTGIARPRPQESKAPSVARAAILAASGPRCGSNVDCAAQGQSALCRGGQCVALDPACKLLASKQEAASDSTLWLGGMFALTREDADRIGKVVERGVEVARQDFAEISHGLPSRDGLGPARGLGVVACDDTEDPRAIAEYLIDRVHVPAIIGFGSSAEVLEIAPSVLIPKGVVGMIVSDGSAAIASVPQPPGKRFTWRPDVTSLQTAQAGARLIEQIIEPMLRANHTLGVAEPMRVGWVRRDWVQGLTLEDGFIASVRFNGKSAMENGHDFRGVVIPEIPDAVRDAQAAQALAELQPNVVVFEAPREVAWIEQALRGTAARPIYIGTDPLDQTAIDLVEKDLGLRGRLYGMYGPLDTANNMRFTMRYNEGASQPVPYTMTPSSAYDGFYVLAYALYLSLLQQSGEPTGASIAENIPLLEPPGTPVDVGPAEILRTFALLRGEHHVDLRGAATSIDMDMATGDATTDLVVDCIRRVPRSTGFEPVELPLLFSAGEKRWKGRLKCP